MRNMEHLSPTCYKPFDHHNNSFQYHLAQHIPLDIVWYAADILWSLHFAHAISNIHQVDGMNDLDYPM